MDKATQAKLLLRLDELRRKAEEKKKAALLHNDLDAAFWAGFANGINMAAMLLGLESDDILSVRKVELEAQAQAQTSPEA